MRAEILGYGLSNNHNLFCSVASEWWCQVNKMVKTAGGISSVSATWFGEAIKELSRCRTRTNSYDHIILEQWIHFLFWWNDHTFQRETLDCKYQNLLRVSVFLCLAIWLLSIGCCSSCTLFLCVPLLFFFMSLSEAWSQPVIPHCSQADASWQSRDRDNAKKRVFFQLE